MLMGNKAMTINIALTGGNGEKNKSKHICLEYGTIIGERTGFRLRNIIDVDRKIGF